MATQLLTGQYRILSEIGRGGMATVYQCADEKHHRTVALKVFRPDLAAAIGSERFLREIAITAALNHPHILPLLDSGAEQQLLYYVMPYVSGGSLRRLLRAGGIPLDAVTRIAREVASALDYAHGNGVIHRDIKPENILFNEGLAVVSDFGIARALSGYAARMTGTGVAIGTLGYMSPEQALGTDELDRRTDVYSLGCVVYEMLVGQTPTFWPGPEDIESERFSELPPLHRQHLDALPGRIEQVLVRALALRPQHRFASPAELAAALSAASQRTTALSDDQVRTLLQRAAELQAQTPEATEDDRLTIGAVEQIAAQVGIPPVHVREAARDIAQHEVTTSQFLQQTRWNRLLYAEIVPGNISADVFPAMVAKIEQRIGAPGHASVVGQTLTWSPANQGRPNRSVVVQVAAQEGSTVIRIQEDFQVEGGRKLAIPAGIIIGLGFGASCSATLGIAGSAGSVIMALFAMAGVAGSISAATFLAKTDQAPALEELKAELAGMARATPAC